MPRWKTAVAIIAGVSTTVMMGGLATVVLPLIGFTAGEVVANWIPLWVLTVLVICPVIGGAITGTLRGETPRKSATLGCLAAALGLSVMGAVIGLGVLVLTLGMIPAHGQETDFTRMTGVLLALGAGTGLVSGAVFGAVGGVSGHVSRRKLGF